MARWQEIHVDDKGGQRHLNTCPSCKAKADAATDLYEGQRGPQPGDIGICFKCGEMLMFGPGLVLVVLPHKDYKALPGWQREHLRLCQQKIADTSKPKSGFS